MVSRPESAAPQADMPQEPPSNEIGDLPQLG
jgi:hypothetical protein